MTNKIVSMTEAVGCNTKSQKADRSSWEITVLWGNRD